MPPRLVLHKPQTNANFSPLPVEPGKMKRVGESYVLSTGQIFRRSQITPEYIFQMKKKNPYFKGTLIKQKNLIFRKQVVIEAVNSEGMRDDRVTKKLQKRFLSKEFNLWNAMRQAFDDAFCYGISVWNPVTEWQSTEDGMEFFPKELRHLPTRTFEGKTYQSANSKQMQSYANIYHSDLFWGIQFNVDTKEMEFYQTWQQDVTKLTNVFYVKDPASEDFGGEPMSLPIIPFIEMIKYAWKSTTQVMNRIGAPVIFIKITAPKDADATNDNISDEEYALKLIKNWGKDTAFVLRDNMEFVSLNITEGNINDIILDRLQQLIVDYFSPTSMIAKEGTMIGGSSSSELDLVNAYINGIHDWLEAAFRPLVQQWLDVNRYDGYTAVVTIPEPEADMTVPNIQKALAGHNTQSLTTNEKRALLDEEELDEDGLRALKEEYSTPAPAMSPNQPGGFSYQPGELLKMQGVSNASANSFRNEGVERYYGELDAGLFTAAQTNSVDAEGNEGTWVTLHGNPVFIRDGEDIGSAVDRHFGPGKFKSEKAKRAWLSHKVVSKKDWAAAKANENQIADLLKGEKTPPGHEFDVLLKDKKIAIEVKTFLTNTNDKITMHSGKTNPDSLQFKKEWLSKHRGWKSVTVLFDNRGDKNDLYYKEGVGGFRLDSMKKTNEKDLPKNIVGKK